MAAGSGDLSSVTMTGGPSRSFADGRYAVRAVLGEGGQKIVYLVNDIALDRDCTLSLIKTEILDLAERQRLEREAQAMARLHHPNIVVVHNIGAEDGRPYVVCEYVRGGDLRLMMQNAAGALPIAQAVAIARDVAGALAHAHARDIVHRDVKPGNIWLDDDGAAKLGDFGLAVRTDHSLSGIEGVMVGTVSYMPPEQALGESPDARSDLYSLGAVLYEMLTGRPPFLGDDAVSVISQHMNTAPVHPTWHNPQIPRSLEELVLRLLAKVPADRYQNAEDVHRDLSAIAGEQSGEARLPVPGANPLDRLDGGIFVGRETEIGELRQALDDALSGRGRLLLLVGEPGIGKTRLAEELVTYARMRSAQVLWGRCYDGEGAPAYWPWTQLIRTYAYEREPGALLSELGSGAGDIAHMVSEIRERLPNLPVTPPVDPEQARFKLFDGVTTFLKNASRSQPLVIVLDDLHWADKPSLLLLQFLAREMRDSRLLVVGTYRDVELGRQHPLAQTLGELAREHLSQRVQLRGLSEDDVQRFVSLTASFEAPRELVAVVYKETEGNPFFIHEVVRLLVSDGRLRRPDEVTSWSVAIPEGVREVVGRRLDRLSEECNALLTVASVIGREFTLDALERLSDLKPDRVLDVVEEALSARVIAEVPRAVGRYSFSHSLIRETLYDELTTTRRVRLHRRIADALEDLYGARSEQHLSELAYHFLEAVHAGGDIHKAVQYAVRAAERATVSVAYEESVDYYEKALQANELHEPPDDAERCDLLLALGDAKWRAGAFGPSRTTFFEAAALARKLSSPEQLAHAALGMGGGFSDFDIGNTDAGLVDILEEVLAVLPEDDSELRAKLMARLAESLTFSRDDDQRRIALAADAAAMARRDGDPVVLAYVLRATYVALCAPSQAEDRLAMATEAVALTEQVGDKLHSLQGQILRCVELLHLGDVAGANAAFDSYSRTTSEIRHRYDLWATEVWKGMQAMLAGRFDDAERTIQQALVVGQREQNANALQLYGVQMAALRREQGRFGELEPVLRGFVAQYPTFPAWRCALATLCIETGKHGEARAIVDEVAADGFAVLHEDWFWLTAVTLLAEICSALGDAARSQQLYTLLLPYATRNVLPAPGAACYGSAARFLGILATTCGRWGDAERHFEQALADNERLASPPLLAHTRYEYARMLLLREGPGAARASELLERARTTATEHGMATLLRQIDSVATAT